MRIATWNVNSIRQRLEHLTSWLKECSPDIVCLQEIKCVDEAFPRLEIESLGYNVVTHGQKTFNGVALLSKLPFDETKSGLAGDALFRPETREAFQSLLGLGLTDALRAVTDEPNLYTFWDYQAGAWQKNWGLRIDHLLLSPQASDRLTNVGVDSYVRAWEKPSDHVPVWADFDLETT